MGLIKEEQNGGETILETSDGKGSIFVCQKCGVFIGSDATSCGACGAKRASHATEIDVSPADNELYQDVDELVVESEIEKEEYIEKFECPECGTIFDEFVSVCSGCGIEFEFEEEESEEEELIEAEPLGPEEMEQEEIQEQTEDELPGSGEEELQELEKECEEIEVISELNELVEEIDKKEEPVIREKPLMEEVPVKEEESVIEEEPLMEEKAVLKETKQCSNCEECTCGDGAPCGTCMDKAPPQIPGIEVSRGQRKSPQKTKLSTFDKLLGSSHAQFTCESCHAFLSPRAVKCGICGAAVAKNKKIEGEMPDLQSVPKTSFASETKSPNITIQVGDLSKKGMNKGRLAKKISASTKDVVEGQKTLEHKKAVALKKMGKGKEAQRGLNKVLHLNPNDRTVMLEKADSHYEQGQYSRASKLYKYLLESDSENVILWNKLGNALFWMGNHKVSLMCYEKVLFLDPDNEEAILNKGYLLMKLGKYDEAIVCADAVLA